MAKPVYTIVKTDKKKVQTQEKVKLQVFVFSALDEPIARRLAFNLGNEQRQIK